MISLTTENTVLLGRRKYIQALEQLQEGFSDIGAHQYLDRPILHAWTFTKRTMIRTSHFISG